MSHEGKKLNSRLTLLVYCLSIIVFIVCTAKPDILKVSKRHRVSPRGYAAKYVNDIKPEIAASDKNTSVSMVSQSTEACDNKMSERADHRVKQELNASKRNSEWSVGIDKSEEDDDEEEEEEEDIDEERDSRAKDDLSYDKKKDNFMNEDGASRQYDKRKAGNGSTEFSSFAHRDARQGPKMWDQWGKWSRCTVTCGVGKLTRWRHCIAGGCSMGEKEAQFKTCNRHEPKIWDQWGKWSCCSASCGIGKITRWRHCMAGGCSSGEKEAQLRECRIKSCR